jgi:hypothetical protein
MRLVVRYHRQAFDGPLGGKMRLVGNRHDRGIMQIR